MDKKEEAEILRKQYLYKKMILSGKLKLPFDSAKKIIGPDSAFHLYSKGILKRNKKNLSKS